MTTSVTDDRQAFEAWAVSMREPTGRYNSDPEQYADSHVQFMWRGWKAALRSQGKVEGWRPIETAPSDGSRILVYAEREGYEPITISAYVLDGRGENGVWAMTGPRTIPPHWMPLPTGPNDLTAIIGEGN